MAGSFNFGEWISARSVIGDTLDEIGKTNEKLFVCTPDVGMNLKRFREHYPDRYIDVGIAEQNCVEMCIRDRRQGAARAGRSSGRRRVSDRLRRPEPFHALF